MGFFLTWLVMTTTPALAIDDAELVRRASTHLQALDDAGELSGAVLIARDGRPLLRRAFGFANLADRVANTPETRFNVASMGKMFTAVAILQLVETGRVSLDGKIGDYLPRYPDPRVRDSVTVHQLLTHTSGMGNFWEGHAKVAKERYKEVAAYLPLFADQPLEFAPGERFGYSNAGYMVLGLIVESVSGQSYFDYVRKHVFEPAGMNESGFFELDRVVPRLATGFSRSNDEPGVMLNNLFVNVAKGTPAGGGAATIDDLLRFAVALQGGKLLRAETVERLTTGKVAYGSRKYAYGFIEEMANGHRIVGHSGGHVGIADELMIFTDLGYVVVILTNGDVDAFWNVQTALKKWIVGATPDSTNYEFTLQLVDSATREGYDAAATAFDARADGVRVRGGVVEQAGRKLLWRARTKQAIDVFRLGLRASADDSALLLGLADAFAADGDRAAATESYTRYLSMEPTDADTRAKFERWMALAASAKPSVPPSSSPDHPR
jgi:D-alanyl-D-alanine carboxypeptidase